mmetsp:Transcript_1629/g.4218  ORF Transcript_1629/g.4218 Transcript_1629/m.4218 type:complete len:110 (-) Transcript_1629:498-827(-)
MDRAVAMAAAAQFVPGTDIATVQRAGHRRLAAPTAHRPVVHPGLELPGFGPGASASKAFQIAQRSHLGAAERAPHDLVTRCHSVPAPLHHAINVHIAAAAVPTMGQWFF